MTSNIHFGSRNLLVKLKEIKFWYSRKFASQNFSSVASLQIFGLTKPSTVLQYKFQN